MSDGVKLGTLGDIFIGLTYHPEDVSEEGTVVLRSSNIQNGRLDFNDTVRVKCNVRENLYVKKNDILMCSRNGSAKLVGKCTLLPELDEPMSFGAFMTVIRTEHNPYLIHFFNSNAFRRQLGSAATSTINQITRKMLDNIEVAVYPVDEEKHIVEVLDNIDSLIYNQYEQIECLDELVKSRFIEMMKQGAATNFLEEFITPYKAERCGEKDLPVLSITKEDGIVLQNEKFKKRIASIDTATYKIVPTGKLVQGIHIDERNFAIQNIVDAGIVSPAYKIWTVNESKAIPEVLAYAMRTDASMAYIRSKFTGSIKRRETISHDDFMAMPINLPTIELQTEFSNFTQQTDKLKLATQETLNELEILKKSLMQKYFG